MNLNDMKTLADLEEVGDIWYQRAHQLREFWQNFDNDEDRRARAFRVWMFYYARLNTIIRMTIKAKTMQAPPNFQEAGVSFPRTTNEG